MPRMQEEMLGDAADSHTAASIPFGVPFVFVVRAREVPNNRCWQPIREHNNRISCRAWGGILRSVRRRADGHDARDWSDVVAVSSHCLRSFKYLPFSGEEVSNVFDSFAGGPFLEVPVARRVEQTNGRVIARFEKGIEDVLPLLEQVNRQQQELSLGRQDESRVRFSINHLSARHNPHVPIVSPKLFFLLLLFLVSKRPTLKSVSRRK